MKQGPRARKVHAKAKLLAKLMSMDFDAGSSRKVLDRDIRGSKLQIIQALENANADAGLEVNTLGVDVFIQDAVWAWVATQGQRSEASLDAALHAISTVYLSALETTTRTAGGAPSRAKNARSASSSWLLAGLCGYVAMVSSIRGCLYSV